MFDHVAKIWRKVGKSPAKMQQKNDAVCIRAARDRALQQGGNLLSASSAIDRVVHIQIVINQLPSSHPRRPRTAVQCLYCNTGLPVPYLLPTRTSHRPVHACAGTRLYLKSRPSYPVVNQPVPDNSIANRNPWKPQCPGPLVRRLDSPNPVELENPAIQSRGIVAWRTFCDCCRGPPSTPAGPSL